MHHKTRLLRCGRQELSDTTIFTSHYLLCSAVAGIRWSLTGDNAGSQERSLECHVLSCRPGEEEEEEEEEGGQWEEFVYLHLLQCVATGSGDGTVKLWSVRDQSCLKTFEGHSNSVLKVIFVTKGMQIISASVISTC